MPAASTDRNLLLGILAYQNAFITKDQLLAGMQAWLYDKAKPLAEILRDQGVLDELRRALLDALVDHHVKQHAGDPQKSLQAVSSASSVRRDLERLPDPDLQASIGHLSRAIPDGDPYATASQPSVGTPTSSGLRFHILRPHAKGNLGEVFVAQDDELHREVALKEIQDRHADQPESRSRFMLEAEITGGLEHPGIVPVYGLGTYADGRPYYAMRFIRGNSLQDAIKHYHPGEPVTSATVERILELRNLLGRLIDVCQAIQYAHDRGVLHRDLKPGNIMLGKYGETLVVDWGLAKAIGRAERQARPGSDEPTLHPASASGSAETIAGTTIGTPAFMSPEQAAGRLDLLGPATDVYSLGATLYAVLTGKTPVDEKEIGIVLAKVQKGDFPRPRERNRDVDPALEAICLKAMALKLDDRYASPKVLANDLEHWLADEPVVAWPEPMTVKAGRWMRRRKPLVSGVAAALLVGLIALTTGAIWYEGQRAEASRKLAFAEEKIRLGLDQARRTRDELRQSLKQPNGVQEFLNQPTRWHAQLRSARADWQRAEDLQTQADRALDPQWARLLKTLDHDLASDQVDYELAIRLEKIRLDTTRKVAGRFGYAAADRDYAAAFAEAGFSILPERKKETVTQIQQSPIRDQLLSALDHWATSAHLDRKAELSGRLLELARMTDPDSWRDKVRDPFLWKDRQALIKLAEEVQADRKFLTRLSPQMFLMMSQLLPRGKTEENWLRTAQAVHPADFLLNFQLAYYLNEKKEALESAGFYRVALTIRPTDATAYTNLGVALSGTKDVHGAIDAHRNALAIDPHFALAWANLGAVLHDQRNLPAALDAFNKAVAIDPNEASFWFNLGLALQDQDKLPAAIDAYKKAVEIDREYTPARKNLAYAQQMLFLREATNKLWGVDDPLVNAPRSSYSQSDYKGQLDANKREQIHVIKTIANKSYVIELASTQFDTYLRLEDSQGKIVAENDDISPINKNSRIVFAATKVGNYRIVATSYHQRGAGSYTLTIREFASSK